MCVSPGILAKAHGVLLGSTYPALYFLPDSGIVRVKIVAAQSALLGHNITALSTVLACHVLIDTM
jgi:hypothetical protein